MRPFSEARSRHFDTPRGSSRPDVANRKRYRGNSLIRRSLPRHAVCCFRPQGARVIRTFSSSRPGPLAPATVLPACSAPTTSPSSATASAGPSAPAALTGTVWQLQSFKRSDSTSVPVPDPAKFTVQFTTDGKMSIRADCNRCSGSYSLTGTSFTANPAVACTRAACSSAPFDQDYVNALVDTTVVRLNGGTLECVSRRGTLVFAQ